jgi:hypothetical protein
MAFEKMRFRIFSQCTQNLMPPGNYGIRKWRTEADRQGLSSVFALKPFLF